MPGGRLAQAMRHLRDLLETRAAGAQTDRRLLEQFAAGRDEAAFTALVERHGPMVLGVCHRVLGDVHAAEDAFQATFLILARKAAALDRRGSVAGWLFTVAHHLALRARAAALRRRAREQEAHMPRPEAPAIDPALRPLLDEELSRLPEKYRAPLVLCYFEGLSNDAAAEQLGWPAGTVKGRLARARELLRARLARRGLALTLATFDALLADQAAPAAVPSLLTETTIQAALQFAAGQAAPVLSAGALALAEGGLRTMTLTKLKIAAVLLLGLVVAGAGAGVLAQQIRPGAKPLPARAAPVADDKKDDKKGGDDKADEEDLAAALKASDRIFVGKIAKVTPMGQTGSIPPSTFGDVKFEIAAGVADKPAEELTLNYSYRDDAAGRKRMALGEKGEVLVGVSGKSVRVLVPANPDTIRVYRSVLKMRALKKD